MRYFMNHYKIVGACAALVISGLFFSNPVSAATYSTTPVSISGSGTLTMEPDEVREVTATFLNTGDVTWHNDGAGYISLYTYEPKYRKSSFDPGTWLGPTQVKRIIEASVAPGEIASMKFQLHAPSTEGSYTETFKLASEERAWVNGGEITLNIKVSSEQLAVGSSETNDDNSGYDGEVTVTTANSVKAKAGAAILFTVGVKNTGTKTWTNYSVNEADVAIASTSIDSFLHPSWVGSQLAYASDSVSPGAVAYITFAFSAPKTNGNHIASFSFAADGVDVIDVEIPVEVTGGAAALVSNDEEQIDLKLGEEPIIRVGILTVDEETDNEVVITSDESDFELQDTEGNLLAELSVGESITAYYSAGYYYFDRGQGLEKSSYGLRFIPLEENAVMEISNFDYRKTRNAADANNTYRNILELRYNSYKDRVWLINELPIEQYLYGLAETSNISPGEYQKALVTAARTYAYANSRYDVSGRGEWMHVNAYADDQVYRGYEHEKNSPTIVQAVIDTKGVIVTYEGELAITPYFSRSDGRTRAWSEVWNGDKPWCKSVPVPWEEGGVLWGHGIGMSALGALKMANDGYQWEEILKYFYTGIDLTKTW